MPPYGLLWFVANEYHAFFFLFIIHAMIVLSGALLCMYYAISSCQWLSTCHCLKGLIVLSYIMNGLFTIYQDIISTLPCHYWPFKNKLLKIWHAVMYLVPCSSYPSLSGISYLHLNYLLSLNYHFNIT